MCCYIQYHQPRGYNALEFEVGCLRFYVLWHYCKLEIVYEDYYHHHQTSTSNWRIFVMTQIEIIVGHVESRAKDWFKKWEQVMSDCNELACFINVGNCAMISIIWRIMKNKLVKYSAQEVHLGIDELSLWIIIVGMWQLVEKLFKRLCLGKIIQY